MTPRHCAQHDSSWGIMKVKGRSRSPALRESALLLERFECCGADYPEQPQTYDHADGGSALYFTAADGGVAQSEQHHRPDGEDVHRVGETVERRMRVHVHEVAEVAGDGVVEGEVLGIHAGEERDGGEQCLRCPDQAYVDVDGKGLSVADLRAQP